MNKKVKN